MEGSAPTPPPKDTPREETFEEFMAGCHRGQPVPTNLNIMQVGIEGTDQKWTVLRVETPEGRRFMWFSQEDFLNFIGNLTTHAAMSGMLEGLPQTPA